METVAIPADEYHFLQKCREIVMTVEKAIHHSEEFKPLLKLSENTAQELWDDESDDVWNKI